MQWVRKNLISRWNKKEKQNSFIGVKTSFCEANAKKSDFKSGSFTLLKSSTFVTS